MSKSFDPQDEEMEISSDTTKQIQNIEIGADLFIALNSFNQWNGEDAFAENEDKFVFILKRRNIYDYNQMQF